MERSRMEKNLLIALFKEEPPLPFKLTVHHSERYGDEEYYIIPDDKKEEVLTKLWPFTPTPKMDQRILDIHQNDFLQFKECNVIRWKNRNVIVSKFYFKTGGCCIDLFTEGVMAAVMILK